MSPWQISINNLRALRAPSPLWKPEPLPARVPTPGHSAVQAKAECDAICAALADGPMTDAAMAEHFGMYRQQLRRRLRRLRDEGRVVERIELHRHAPYRLSWWALP